MGFLAPWFLAGLAALGVPVFAHLLRKHVLPPRAFSSLMFLQQGKQSSTRHRRLQYLLLFSLRMLLVFLLVLAFAGPFFRVQHAGANDRLMVIVLDRSLSMHADNRFADAKSAALKLLDGKPPAEHVQVMALDGRLQVLTQPAQDATLARAAIDGMRAGDSHGNFGELGRGIHALFETEAVPVDLHLFSDLKKTDMPTNFVDLVLPGNVRLLLHPVVNVKTAAMPNWAVQNIEAPAQLPDPKDLKVSHVKAVIAGYNTPAATKTVSLVVNGSTIATRTANIPANGQATVEFAPLDVPHGYSKCAIRISPADGLPQDDSEVFAVNRTDPEKVLFVHQGIDSRSQFFYGAALAATSSSSFVLQPMAAEQTADVDPSKYAFVVIADALALPPQFEHTLEHYVQNGGSVLVAAGTSAAYHTQVPVFGEKISGVHDYSRANGYTRVSWSDASHPVMRQSAAQPARTGAENSAWSELKIFYAANVDATRARVIAKLADGTPLLMDKQIGEGHVLLFTSGLDNVTNDLPTHPVFVPFVDQSARYLSGNDRSAAAQLVDSYVQLRSATSQPGDGSVEVIGPDGRRALTLGEAATARSYRLQDAGYYQVRYANGREAVLGVNADPAESNLTPIPEDILSLWSRSGDGIQAQSVSERTREITQINSIWWYIMLVVLAIALAESFVASRHLGTLREEA